MTEPDRGTGFATHRVRVTVCDTGRAAGAVAAALASEIVQAAVARGRARVVFASANRRDGNRPRRYRRVVESWDRPYHRGRGVSLLPTGHRLT